MSVPCPTAWSPSLKCNNNVYNAARVHILYYNVLRLTRRKWTEIFITHHGRAFQSTLYSHCSSECGQVIIILMHYILILSCKYSIGPERSGKKVQHKIRIYEFFIDHSDSMTANIINSVAEFSWIVGLIFVYSKKIVQRFIKTNKIKSVKKKKKTFTIIQR